MCWYRCWYPSEIQSRNPRKFSAQIAISIPSRAPPFPPPRSEGFRTSTLVASPWQSVSCNASCSHRFAWKAGATGAECLTEANRSAPAGVRSSACAAGNAVGAAMSAGPDDESQARPAVDALQGYSAASGWKQLVAGRCQREASCRRRPPTSGSRLAAISGLSACDRSPHTEHSARTIWHRRIRHYGRLRPPHEGRTTGQYQEDGRRFLQWQWRDQLLPWRLLENPSVTHSSPLFTTNAKVPFRLQLKIHIAPAAVALAVLPACALPAGVGGEWQRPLRVS